MQLLQGLPFSESRVELAGIATAVLEGGQGVPVVLLHEPGSFDAQWFRVLGELATTHRVVAPDLPGHGASETDGPLDAERFLGWLGELIHCRCDAAPVLVGHLGSGALAHASRSTTATACARSCSSTPSVSRSSGPGLGLALAPSATLHHRRPRTYDGLMERCTADFAAVRGAMGERWQPYAAYTLDRARSSSGKAALRVLMRELAVPAIPPARLQGITVPTTLIWAGRTR